MSSLDFVVVNFFHIFYNLCSLEDLSYYRFFVFIIIVVVVYTRLNPGPCTC